MCAMKNRILFLIVLLMLAACTVEVALEPVATAVPPTATLVQVEEAATAVPTNPPAPIPETVSAEPTELAATEISPTELPSTTAPVSEEIVIEYGRTQEGAFFHGNPEAPVTLIDFSDFL